MEPQSRHRAKPVIAAPAKASKSAKPPKPTKPVKATKATKVAKEEEKRGIKRAIDDEEEDELMDEIDEEDEIKDEPKPLPDLKKATTPTARARSVEPMSETYLEDGGRAVRAAKRTRRAPTPVGPLNSVPRLVQSVHASDISDGIAVQVSTGLLPTSGKGTVLPRKLFVWGSGDSGQFGVGAPEDDKPNKLNKPKPFGNKEISMQIDDGDMGEGGIEIVVGGGMHSVLIDSLGRILTSGAEDYGTLGRKHRGSSDEAEECYFNFAPVEGISPTGRGVQPADGKEGEVEKFRATRVASADAAGAALDDRGRLRSWGYFKDGEGRVCFADSDAPGANREQWHPIPLPGIEHEQFAAVAAGENHILALTLHGKVFSWGTNTCYQLGRTANPRKIAQKFSKTEPPRDCDLTPTLITGLGECKRIFAGLSNGFAVEKSGKVVAWGLNTKGQTGTGLKSTKIATPHTVAALSPARHGGAEVVQIVGGNFHTAFLLSNGQVYICGDSDEGKLGLPKGHASLKNASATNPIVVREPVHVPFPDPPSWAPASTKAEDGKTKIVAISAGMRFTLALAADGTLYSWGTTSDDAMGQPSEEMGGDQSKDTPSAVAMPGQPGAWRIMAASTAGQHSLALAVKPPQDD
ncbi:RCC1/BLIP-II [Testicularia cyperi]|uniref:RCC1/BLIP-II n=1 Tax=Testicularia cyperi TaxID=1882483 RepID=A0A317XVX4_9BASI|nr:RCC1/BLIP-II [Testicularia cyperi]